MKLFIAGILTLIFSLPVYSATLGVGDCLTCEYTTIQSAVNAANSGDVVSVEDGTYTEDLTLKDGVTVSGNPSDIDAVVIVGSVVAPTNTTSEFQYFRINATGKSIGVSVRGTLIFKYSSVLNATNGIFVAKNADLDAFQITSSNNQANGLITRKGARVELENSTLSNNGKAGAKIRQRPTSVEINESVLDNNKHGVSIVKSQSKKRTTIAECNISNNKIGVKMFKARANLIDNTYTDNLKDLVKRPKKKK